MRRTLAAAIVLMACLSASRPLFANPAPGPLTVSVDATDAARNLFHTRVIIPATAGPLTLFYPEWIPGEHEPSGPINGMVGLKFTAAGQTLAWQRDDVNLYAFHVVVPAGATAVEVSFDFLSPPEHTGFSSSADATPGLAVVSWNQVLLYPEGVPPRELACAAHLRLPAGWKYASALETASHAGNDVDFRPVPLTQLIDSPVMSGAHFRVIDLAPEITPPHHLDLAADSDSALDLTQSEINAYHQMVRETGALFGARHYNHYDFLVSLSDYVAHFGLEHHQSSDNRMRERAYIDGYFPARGAGLLTHEFVHSWNGKYRRPAGLATADYQQPMRDNLLWVYEGLTQYLGEILAGRSGLYTPEEFRQQLALTAAQMEYNRGREWRPLVDTAISAPKLSEPHDHRWAAWRRGVDYYEESDLVWLEADVLMRQLSKGQRSMDDFCHLFYGGGNTGPDLKTYTLDDVVNTLNQIVPYDWRGFLNQHINQIQPHVPTAGIDNSGWKLDFDETPGYIFQGYEQVNRRVDLRYSLGLIASSENDSIVDVIPQSPAFTAGLAPGMKLISVNGRAYSPWVLHSAIAAAKTGSQPIVITAQNGAFVREFRLDYHGGERYPVLRRNHAREDLLSDIIRPHVPKPGK